VARRSTIVVGVDGSESSRWALRYALEDAVRRDGQVQAVQAFYPPEYWPASWGLSAPPTVEQVTANLEVATRQTVDTVVSEIGGAASGVPVEILVMPGSPAKVLVERAGPADLLVVGHRGRLGFPGASLGSVALRCVQHAPCPVVVVRPSEVPAADPTAGTG